MRRTISYFDFIMADLGTWLVCGVFMDGWAHNHEGDTIESFFTPWHASLYSGFLAVAGFLIWTVVRNHRRGASWRQAVPDGYDSAVIGVVIFAISGVCDLIWHTIFGIEVSVSAGFSPPHLGIMIGIGLIVTGPFRAAWRRPGPTPQHWSGWLPMVVSLHLILSEMTFVTQYANPLVVVSATTDANDYLHQALGAVSILLHGAILMGWILVALRRWALPPGSMTSIFGLNALAMSIMRDTFYLLPGAIVAGIIVDVMMWYMDPAPSHPVRYHVFAFVVPLVYYICYFVTLMIVSHILWPIPLWTGATFMAGVVAVLLSYMILPSTYIRPAMSH